jgi:hypothetical protein
MKNNKQTINKKRVDKLFNSFLKEGLLKDRSEYDEEDIQSAYPKLNEKEAKLLFLKIQKWKYSKEKKKKSSENLAIS